MPDLAHAATTDGALRRIGLAIPAFTVAVGLSAFLLFSIQPMFTKIVLPRLGGSPAVWSVAMVFFQAMLLAGYGYAHWLTTRLAPRKAALVHVAAMLVVLVLALPIGLTTALGQPPSEGATLWLLGVFGLSVGLPFFIVSAHGPLLQAWFARSGHGSSGDPYFLYAASNLGSLVALLSYPVLIEPLASTRAQTTLWSFGFALLIAAVALCAAFLPSRAAAAQPALERADAPGWAERGRWCVLAFVPSGLLVAVTAHISTDVAAAPLLWVIPLALFLLTFIVTFQSRPVLPHRFMVAVQPALVVAAFAFGGVLVGTGAAAALLFTLLGFFATAMVFHGELARLRPKAERLTEFYVWMSVGGVLGGIFAGLLSPHLFDSVAEYGILLFAALVVRFAGRPEPTRRAQLLAGFGVLAASLAVLAVISPATASAGVRNALGLAGVCLGLIGLMALVTDARRLALILAPVLATLNLAPAFTSETVSVRSFFGVSKITTSDDGTLRYLAHGTTFHGAQRIAEIVNGLPPEPLTYYYRGGPFDQAIAATRTAMGGTLGHVAVIGLGTGSQACLKRPGEDWSFYEIDPHVVRIARDPSHFTFLTKCAPDARIDLGDARLKLQDAAPASYSMIIVDAFSSDSIPVHLLTREAMELYRAKLAPGGSIVFHLSNRNLTLAPFVAATAATLGLETWRSMKQDLSAAELKAGKASTDIALVTDRPAVVAALQAGDKGGHWRAIARDRADVTPWTDDFSNVLAAGWLRFREDRQPTR